MIFWTYLLTRLFTNHKEIRIEGDEARHLKTAKTFYKLWNNSFYDFHPPLYSFLIKLLHCFFIPYYMAGILVSLASSLGLFWITAKLYVALGLSPYATQIALVFLTFNYTLIYFSNRIFRYQLFAFLFTTTFYCLLTNHWWYCGVLWGLTSLTCSFNGLRFFWVWLILALVKPYDPNIFIPLVVFAIIYTDLWLLPKIMVYSKHRYYPSGAEGKLDLVENFNLRQLISPMYFPFNYAYYGSKYIRKDLRYWHTRIMGIFGLYPISLIIAIPFVILSYFTIKGMFHSPFWLVVVTLALLYPSLTYKYRPRNSVMVIPLIGYFIGIGFPPIPTEWLNFAILALLGGFLLVNRVPIVLIQPKRIAYITSRILNNLPHKGILVEGLIAYPIAYNTHKRVVIMTHTPDKERAIYETDLAIKEFDLHYAVFSDRWIMDFEDGYPVIDYIKTFKLIKTIRENGDVYYVYEVPTNSTPKETCQRVHREPTSWLRFPSYYPS